MLNSPPFSSSPAIKLESIAREQHNISRKDVSANALRVLYRLREAGFQSYLVGGAVRDLLLEEVPKDFDVATDATPEQVKALLRNCRLSGRRFRLAHIVFGREIIEVATFRANDDNGSGDRKVLDDGRLLFDNVYGSIEEDVVRRDFTVNALYYAIEDFSVRDYVGGFADINARVLRLIGDPETRYREDPVRMLRAVRLAAKLGFAIEEKTAEPIRRMSPLLKDAAAARLFEECLKLFLYGHAVASFEGLEKYGLLDVLFPETSKALSANRSGALRDIIIQGLRSTDQRIQSGNNASPSFLFALLLWPAYCHALVQLQNKGMKGVDAERRAADLVTLHEIDKIAIPRRFSTPMQEIWLMQPRFELRQPKRVARLLTHPRFRAGFDFLQMRAASNEELKEHYLFWEHAQSQPEQTVQQLQAKNKPARSPRKKRKKPADASAE